ncbi:MAG: hypothetical protein PHT02_01190 [Tissierellia bacterium]|nr:hypothetical protein [Tissierellia bacterium]
MKTYKHVYFRINTPMYYKAKYGVGFANNEDKDLFNKLVTEIFIKDGWEVKKERVTSSSCPTVIKDKQELYLHPQSLSGVIEENNIIHIENLINNSDIFKFEITDIYEDVFDLSDEDYIEILKSKRAEIEVDLLETFKTKRSNLYITNLWTAINRVLDKYRIKRLSHYIGVISSDNIDVQFMYRIVENLRKSGKIITAETRNGEGYRTANKKEMKELKSA